MSHEEKSGLFILLVFVLMSSLIGFFTALSLVRAGVIH